MTKKQLQKEWQKLIHEIQKKLEIDAPYSSNIVRTRELLLLSQVELAKVETGENKKFHTEIYQNIMKYYQSKNI